MAGGKGPIGPLAGPNKTILKFAAPVAGGGTAPGTSGGSYGGSSTITANAITAPDFGALTISGNQILAPNGKRVRLSGSHTWSDAVDIITTAGQGAANTGANSSAFDFTAYLQVLANQGATSFRLWAWESNFDGGGTYGTVSPLRYAQSGGKSDLSQINPAFISRIVSRVTAANAAGIYPMVMLFDGASVVGAGGFTTNNPWATNPFNSANNINGVNGDPNNTGNGAYSHQQTSGTIFNYQTAFADAVISALAGLHYFIEICNESATDTQTQAWQDALANHIKGLSNRPLVCISAPADNNSNANQLNSWMQNGPADLYTPSGAGGLYQTGNIPAPNGGKPVIVDTDHVYGEGGDGAWVWAVTMAGYAGTLYMDDLHGSTPYVAGCLIPGGSGNDGPAASARTAMAQVAYLEGLLDTTGMVPSGVANGYACLANQSTGMYLVYCPNGGTPVLNLSGSGQELGLEWYDLSGSGNLTSIASIATNGSAVGLPCPTGAGVLVIRPATVTVTQAASGTLSPTATSGTVGQAITGTYQLQNATTAYVRLRVSGQDQGSPVQLTGASGSYSLTPSAADTAAVVLTLDQAGTQVLWTSAPITVAPVQAPAETLTLNDPGAQTAGDSFAISGSIANKAGSPALQLLNGTTAMSVTLTLSGSTFTGSVPGQANDLVLSVKDTTNNVTSNVVDVTVAAQQQQGGGGSGTPVPAGSLPTFQFQARTDVPANSPVTFGQLFARSDLPNADIQAITATGGGQTISLQADQTNVWSKHAGGSGDNSLRCVALSGFTTADIPAGTTLTFQFGTASQSLSGSGLTASQFSALCDFKLKVGAGPLGGNSEYGSDTFTVSVNDILANFQQYNSSTGYGGNNPLGGWRVVRSGPFCTEFEVWRMLKRDSDGASHKWVKCKMWPRAWKLPGGGYHFECLPSLRQDQSMGAHPAGTVGASSQGRHCGQMELFNGATRIAAYGGPNDPRVVNTDQSAFNTSAGVLTNASAISWVWDQSDAVAFGGAGFCVSGSGVPSGLAQNSVYMVNALKQFITNRGLVQQYSGGVSLGSAGSGGVTITPIMFTYPADGNMGALPDASVPWVGNGGAPRPQYMIGHNTSYILRNCKMFPNWRLDLTVPNYVDPFGTNSFSMGRPPVRQDIEQYGDNLPDLRIGYLHRHQINLLLNPLDRSRELKMLQQAFGYAEFDMWQSDPQTGMMVNGSENALGPMRGVPSFVSRTGGGAAPFVGWDDSADCWQWAYNNYMSSAHQPFYMPVAFLRTGHACFQEMMEQCSNTMVNSQFDRNSKGDAVGNIFVDFYTNNSNIRAVGWGLRTLGTTDRMCEDASPTRAITSINISQQSHWYSIWSGSPEAGANNLGLPYYGIGPYGGNYPLYSPFMDSHAVHGLSVEVTVGDYDWSGCLNRYFGPLENLNNNLDYFLTWEYHLPLKDTSGNYYTSFAAVYGGPPQGMDGETDWQGVTPQSSGYWATTYENDQSFKGGAPDGGATGVACTIIAGPLNLTWIEPEFHNARSIMGEVYNRMNTPPFSGMKWTGTDHSSGETDCFPMWAIALYGGAGA